MNRWVESEVSFDHERNLVGVTLWECTKGTKDRWPNRTVAAIDYVRLNGLFGRPTMPQIHAKILKIRNDQYSSYKRSLKYNDLVQRLCNEFTPVKTTIDDPKTHEMVNYFKSEK